MKSTIRLVKICLCVFTLNERAVQRNACNVFAFYLPLYAIYTLVFVLTAVLQQPTQTVAKFMVSTENGKAWLLNFGPLKEKKIQVCVVQLAGQPAQSLFHVWIFLHFNRNNNE